jgi:hypothetical protein
VYRPFQFHERSQQFIGADDETLSIVAVASAIQIFRPSWSKAGLANLPCFPANFPLWRQK